MTTTANRTAQIYNPANMSPQELIDNFVVRQNEFRRLYNALKEAPMVRPEQHYIVVGPRGSGKSTLLQRLYHEIRRDTEMSCRIIPILLPEEQYQIVNLAGLWETVLEALDQEAGFAGIYDSFEAGLNGGDGEEYAFACLIDALRSRGRKLILFLENIGDLLAKFTERDHQRFRERLLTCADLRIVGASAVVLEHTYSYSQPLFDFFQFEYLRELNRQEVYTLLKRLAKSRHDEHVVQTLHEQPERIEILRRLTGGIPRTIVLLFEVFADEERGDSYQDLQQVLDRVTPLYKHRMDGLTPARQRIIDCVAMNWDAMTVQELADKLRIDYANEGQRQTLDIDIDELVKNSLLQRVSDPSPAPLYQIAERFFNIWYLMRYGKRNDRNRVRWFVRFLEAWCGPEDLQARAKKHLSMLREKNVDPAYALNVTQALANTHLGPDLQESLIRTTRDLLTRKDSSLLEALSPSDNELFDQAEMAYKAKQYSSAYALLNDIVNLSPAVLSNRALCCERLGDDDAAEHHYRQALEAGPNNTHTLRNFADFLEMRRKDYDAAERYYRQALEANPNDAYTLSYCALFQEVRRKDYDAAEHYYRQSLEADPNDAHSLGFFAEFLETRRHDYDAAERYYQRSLEVDPLYEYSLSNFAGFLEVRRKDYVAAEGYYLRAIEQGDTWSARRLVQMCLEQCRSREVALKTSVMLNATSDQPADQLLHASVLVWNGQISEAMILATTVLTANSDLEPLAELRDFLILLIAAERYEEVWKLFNDATLKLKDRYRPVYYALLAFDRKGRASGYTRMGSEFKETVEELVQRIEKLRRTCLTAESDT